MPREQTQSVTVKLAARTDVGQVRSHNEDSILLSDLTSGQKDPAALRRVGPRGLVLGVCDGMGGAAAGEIASRIAAEAVVGRMAAVQMAASDESYAATLSRAVEHAGEAIREDVKRHPSRRGMGTTCTAAAVRGDALFVAQVGDSRAYLYRLGQLTQLTKDQSLLHELIELGQLDPKAVGTFSGANVILQAVGSTEKLGVVLTHLSLRQGDRLLICSDGLHGLVPDEAIAGALAGRSVHNACERLVELANHAGGRDNISVVVAEFGGPGLLRCAPEDIATGTPYVLSDRARELAAEVPLAPSAPPFRAHGPGPLTRRQLLLALSLFALAGAVAWSLRLGQPAASPRPPVAASSLPPIRSAPLPPAGAPVAPRPTSTSPP